MTECSRTVEQEMADLKEEIDRFKLEQERVRAIVGKIGGVPTTHARLLNIIFIMLVVVILAISLISGGTLWLAMTELAVAALSVKLIYLIHNQSRVNHFQLWILSSIEWRLCELSKDVRILNKKGTPDA